MNNKKNYRKGKRIEIIKALYACGCLPYKSLRLYPWKTRITQEAVLAMEREGLLEIKKTETGKQINLKNWNDESAEYMDYLPYAYLGHYEEIKEEVWKASSDFIRGERLHKNAEIILMMHQSGIGSYPDEKKDIRERGVRISSADKMYFTAREIKNVKPYRVETGTDKDGVKKIIGSRLNGMLATPGGNYGIYNLGNRLIEWERYGESKMAQHLQRVLEEKREDYEKEDVECVLLANDEMLFIRVIENENERRYRKGKILLNIDYAYEKMYGLPINRDGEKMLAIMSSKNWKERMKERLLPQGADIKTSYSVACDGFINNVFILLFCIPDIAKLKLFYKRAKLEMDKEKFEIYCFTYQIPMLASLAGEYVTLRSIELEEYYIVEVEEGYL